MAGDEATIRFVFEEEGEPSRESEHEPSSSPEKKTDEGSLPLGVDSALSRVAKALEDARKGDSLESPEPPSELASSPPKPPDDDDYVDNLYDDNDDDDDDDDDDDEEDWEEEYDEDEASFADENERDTTSWDDAAELESESEPAESFLEKEPPSTEVPTASPIPPRKPASKTFRSPTMAEMMAASGLPIGEEEEDQDQDVPYATSASRPVIPLDVDDEGQPTEVMEAEELNETDLLGLIEQHTESSLAVLEEIATSLEDIEGELVGMSQGEGGIGPGSFEEEGEEEGTGKKGGSGLIAGLAARGIGKGVSALAARAAPGIGAGVGAGVGSATGSATLGAMGGAGAATGTAALAAAGPVGLAIAAVVGGMAVVGLTLKGIHETIKGAIHEISDFSPQIKQAEAYEEMINIMTQLERNSRIGDDLAEYHMNMTDIHASFEELKTRLLEVALPTMIKISEGVLGIMEFWGLTSDTEVHEEDMTSLLRSGDFFRPDRLPADLDIKPDAIRPVGLGVW